MNKINALKKITFEQMVKFYAAIESRNAYYQNNEDISSEVGALMPFLEMINHSKHTKCRV